MGWANRITVLRGLLTVAVWVILLLDPPFPAAGYWWAAFVLFVFTAVTDVVDGALARHLGDVSVFGRIADPLVDKLLVLGTMVVLVSLPGVTAVLPAWAVVIMMAREFVVTALRGAVEGKGVSFQALPLGKLKMLLQCTAVGAVLVWGAGGSAAHVPVPLLGTLLGSHWNWPHLLAWLATIATAVSGTDYAVRASRILARE